MNNIGSKYSLPSGGIAPVSAGEREASFIRRVYAWMTFGLLLSLVSGLVAGSTVSDFALESTTGLIVTLAVIVGLVIAVSIAGSSKKVHPGVAIGLFSAFSIANGALMGGLFVAVESTTLISAFAVAAGMFAVTAIWGWTTKRDLSSWGQILFMGLFGLIIAVVVTGFVGGGAITLVVSGIGVILFCAMTAYDMQKLKEMAREGLGNEHAVQKAAVVGALDLYLNLINLFMFILNFFDRD